MISGRRFLLAFAFCLPPIFQSSAQSVPNGFVLLTGTHIQSATHTPLAAGTIDIVPTGNDGYPVTASAGGDGGQITTTPVSVPVTNGAVAPNTYLPDGMLSSPQNLAFKMTIRDASGQPISTLRGVQPSSSPSSTWCSTTANITTCNLDLWKPNVPAQALVQTGPTGNSAYQMAVQNGFQGTLAQWLASLQGPTGNAATVSSNGTNGGFDVIGPLAAGTAFGAPTATGQGSVAAALAACPAGSPCTVDVDPAYAGNDYSGILQTMGQQLTLLPYGTRLQDRRAGQINDTTAETPGTAHVVGAQIARTLYKPLAVNLTRSNNIVTLTGTSDTRWCKAQIIIAAASDPSFNSGLDGNNNYISPGKITCSASVLTYAQTGPNATATATLTTYPFNDTNQFFPHIAAGGGAYNFGTEALAHDVDTANIVVRMGLNHLRGDSCDFYTKGDAECVYMYMNYHQSDGGNGDDENLTAQSENIHELPIVPSVVVSSVAANRGIYVNQVGGGTIVGDGHFLVLKKNSSSDATNTAQYLGGSVVAIDPTPPASLDPSTKLLTVANTAVPVSTAWGTFSPVLTPTNGDYGITMSTTLTQTGGAGTAQTGEMCFVSGPRFERLKVTVSGGVATGKFRNQFLGTDVRQWAQGGVCNSNIGGGTVMQLNASTYVQGPGGVAQVLPLWVSPDSQTVGYALNSAASFHSVTDLFPNILKETVANVNLSRSGGVVSMGGVPAYIPQAPGQSSVINWCGHTITITGATDASLNGTFPAGCEAPSTPGNYQPFGYTWSQSGADTYGSATATYDSGAENFSIFPAEIVTNTVDETLQCKSLSCYIETPATDFAFAAGQLFEDHTTMLHMTAHPIFQECYSSYCADRAHYYVGRGVRGTFWHDTISNQNPLSMYQRFGGTATGPTAFNVSGYWARFWNMDSTASPQSIAITPGFQWFWNDTCPQRLDYSQAGPCQGSQDTWIYRHMRVSNLSGGSVPMEERVDVQNGGLAYYFGYYRPMYQLGFQQWALGHPDYGSGMTGWMAGTVELNNHMLCTSDPNSCITSAAISGANPASGLSASCISSGGCTNLRGSYAITGSAGAGTILTLQWPTTNINILNYGSKTTQVYPTSYNCTAYQNGGSTWLGIGNSVASTTGMQITSAVAITAGATINYTCQP